MVAAQFEKLKGKGIAWLRTIRQRFLPPDVEKDTVFTPLQGREDFRALFKRGSE